MGLDWIRRIQQAGGLGEEGSETGPANGAEADRAAVQRYLVVGLGNPGRAYAATRHNAGFMVVDALARRLGASFGRSRHQALLADARYGPRRVLLAKPQTYMNLSGRAVGPLVRYYRLPLDHLLVVYDDLDLPFGTVRLRPGGGHGGHKGMKSVIEALGGRRDFPRLRIGIGRPPGRLDAAEYVLRPFTAEEREQWPWVLDRAVEGVLVWLDQGLDAAMNQVNAARSL